MPRILACFKWVVDAADIRVAPDSATLLFDRVSYRISDYDRNAIEEAVRLKERYGGSAMAVTVGSPAARKSLREVLSRGADEAFFVVDPAFENLEPAQTAAILAAAIKSRIGCDLIVCGEGSGDLYAQQVGPRLAENLGISCIAYVRQIALEGKKVVAERRTEMGIEVVEASLPALVTVLPEINTPRIPGLKDTLAASKKPITEIAGSELGQEFAPCLQTVSLRANTMERVCTKFGSEEAEIGKFVQALLKTGVIG